MEIVAFLLICGIIVSLFVKKDRKQKRDDNLKSSQSISVGNNRSQKNNQPYAPGTQYLKRSELSYEDIERLRREAEMYECQEHIELTATTIQQLRLYIAALYDVDPDKIDMLSDGRVLLDNQGCGNWHYNVLGHLEYYHSAKQTESVHMHIQPEYSENGGDDCSDASSITKSKGKVIRGPW